MLHFIDVTRKDTGGTCVVYAGNNHGKRKFDRGKMSLDFWYRNPKRSNLMMMAMRFHSMMKIHFDDRLMMMMMKMMMEVKMVVLDNDRSMF